MPLQTEIYCYSSVTSLIYIEPQNEVSEKINSHSKTINR